MMKRLLFIVSVLISLRITAQQNSPVADTTVYTYVDSMPQYPGKPGAMMQYLAANIKYEGGPCALPKLYMQFIVNSKGEITQPKVYTLQEPDCPELTVFFRSVEKVLAAMPVWTPGKLNSNPVSVRLNVPMFLCPRH